MGFSRHKFENEVGTKLAGTKRHVLFNDLADRLYFISHPMIVEVGCIRTTGSWELDGQSTKIWNWMAEHGSAQVYSYDADISNINMAMSVCPKVNFGHCDGVLALSTFQLADKIDLLFLDGVDCIGSQKYNSWIQHAAMLGAIWHRLRPGCIIAVDGCVDDGDGKDVIIRDFFNRMGNFPIIRGHITAWEKP